MRLEARHKGLEWEVSMSDNEIGIDSASWERIFDIFQRLHPRGRYPGTGLGLAVCKRIAERHSGRIAARSKVRGGNRVRSGPARGGSETGGTR